MSKNNKQRRYDNMYMSVAHKFAEMSYGIRLKVGSVIVTEDGVVLPGWNGMPSGMSNECETKVYLDRGASEWLDWEAIKEEYNHEDSGGRYKLVTKDEVLHAESNSISKAARSTIPTKGATLYVTTQPCIHCAKLIIQAGISRVVYGTTYRCDKGLQLLRAANINVEKLENA